MKPIPVDQAMTLLGGLTPAQFMTTHWQKKPLLVRGAVPAAQPLIAREALLAMTKQEEVQSRLIELKPISPLTKNKVVSKAVSKTASKTAPKDSARAHLKTASQLGTWALSHGPFKRLPSLKTPNWTVLIQQANNHSQAVANWLMQWRFLPAARLDDVMISYATDGGGVGPHFDSYDVFLVQMHGARRWRIGRQKDLSLVPDLPLKILQTFEPEEEFVLKPGDMLYLPPNWAHDGVAVGECMTYSVGFKSPDQNELGVELLQRITDAAFEALQDEMPRHARSTRYQDPDQQAVTQPAQMPVELAQFAMQAFEHALQQADRVSVHFGEWMTQPHAQTQFDEPAKPWSVVLKLLAKGAVIQLDRRSQMLYDKTHVFINGESYRCAGEEAVWLRNLANERQFSQTQWLRASNDVKKIVKDWWKEGWLNQEN